VNVATAGNYNLKLHLARNPTGASAVKVLFGGVDKTGDISVPSTGGWQTWTDLTKTVSLAAGTQVMRLSASGGDFNVDWIEVSPSSGGATGTPLTVYGDALAADWADWSWSTVNNFAATSNVKTGSRAIDVGYYAWGGLSLHKGTPVSTSGYSAVKFWVFGGTGSDKPLRVFIQASDTAGASPAVNVTAVANGWTEVTVPLAALGNPSTINRINIQDNSGATQPTITFDEIRLVP
jgi:hypothetical protein